jgi:TolB protein
MTAKTTLLMYVALAAAILAACLVLLLATPTKRAEAAFPGKNGKIAFQSNRGDRAPEIVTMNANGDNKTQLTNNRVSDFDPAFSPNGKKIAFASGSESLDIFTMSATGTNKKKVTTSTSFDFDPAWSPDGTRIAFTRVTPNSDLKIYVMKAARESETNRPQRLTTSGSGVFEYAPAWSPNGTRIAFASNPNGAFEGDFDLFSIRPDGSGRTRLTTTSIGNSPAWSPDGTKIAFSGKQGADRPWWIFVMKAAPESETNRPKRLTGSPRGDIEPDWQPLPAGSGGY